MAKRTKFTTFWAKEESTYGTDATPDGTNNAVRAYEGEIDPEVDQNERAEMGITNSRLAECSGKQRNNITMKIPMKGSGTAGTPPKGVDALLLACGLEKAVVPSTSVTYKPTDSTFKSATIWANVDGIRHDCLGAVGELKGEIVNGQIPFFNFEMKSLWEDPTDQTFPTTHTPDTTKPKVAKNLSGAIDSFSAVFKSFKFALNNEISEREDFNAAYGIAGFDVVDRNPDAEVEIEAHSLADKDWWAKLAADAIMTFSIPMSVGAGNILTISGNCKIRNLKYGDANKTRITTMQLQLCRDASDTPGSELSLAFT